MLRPQTLPLQRLSLAMWLSACLLQQGAAAEGPVSLPVAENGRGKLLASSYCVQCHALPSPGHLDRRTWEKELLPKMRILTGLVPPPARGFSPDIELLKSAHVFPETPRIPAEAFKQISDYYLAEAPERTTSLQKPDAMRRICRQFTVVSPPHRRVPPLTTMAQIDARQHVVLVGDAEFQGMDVLTPDGARRDSLALGNIPTAVMSTPRGIYFSCIGNFFPRDEPLGQVLFYERTPNGVVRHQIGPMMPRLTDIKVADLNGDREEDFVLCVYGNLIGRLSWFEGRGKAEFVEHVLFNKPGALRAEVLDLDGDGNRDIAVLVAQETESFLVFTGDGKGGFTQHLIFQRPPSWGHSGFQFADFDGDGRLDLLVSNGDNADFTTTMPRPYHGLRIYRNLGGLRFEETWFQPMNGAYRAIAKDFDQDGDLDIAAISFFPDYAQTPEESFLYFENVGGRGKYEFSASTIPEALSGRWMTMDAGDLDGDGDEDLVLGNMMRMPGDLPESLKKRWEADSPSLLILKNNLKPAR